MKIRITSKMTKAGGAALRRRAQRYWTEANVDTLAFCKVGRNEYEPMNEEAPTMFKNMSEDWHRRDLANRVARRMMAVAGETFNYELV